MGAVNRAATTEGLASAAPARRRVRLGTAPRRGRAPRPFSMDYRLADRLESVLPPSPARWEWTLAVVALFVLGRYPVLFVRQRMAGLFDAPVAFMWQDDAALRGAFAGVSILAVAAVLWKGDRRSWVRQPFLLAFLGFAFLSALWSVERSVTLWRAGLFAGAAAVGWFVGDRFSLHDQITVVATLAIVAAAASLVAFGIWPQFAGSTNGVAGLWSGVYVNRNELANVMCLGLLAAPFLWKSLDGIGRTALVLFGGVESILLWGSGSRTGLVGILAALWVSALLFAVRGIGRSTLTAAGNATVCATIAAVMGLLVQRNWPIIVALLGRRTDLSQRTATWAVDRQLWHVRPFQGWGFEAIWTHAPTVRLAKDTVGFFPAPFFSHNGYYEILLGVGVVGFAIFLAFIVSSVVRCYACVWRHDGVEYMWPLALVVFAVVVNFSESFFVSSEATWALVVAAAVAASRTRFRPGRPNVSRRRLSLSVPET
jgi:exopolysaccharide production protein ExoQ